MATIDNSLGSPEVGLEFVRSSQVFISVSPGMRALEKAAKYVALSDMPLLITGESGTGKNALAFQVHRLSHRCDGPFSRLECSDIQPGDLRADSETEAGDYFSEVHAGTVILHEISLLSLECQIALHELLAKRFGTDETASSGARFIFTTHANMDQEIRLGRFREDLYYRISGFCLRIPPLRHRKEDIAGLTDLFIDKYVTRLQCSKPVLSDVTRRFFAEHTWPGNLRELEEATRTIAAVGDERLAMAALKSAHRGGRRQSERSIAMSLKDASRAASRAAEKDLILKVLSRTRWNRKRAAGELKISYKALLYKLKQMGVQNPNANSQGEA